MRKFEFTQVDAFTNQPLQGNPCAIVFDADGLDDATMLAITREMNLSETSFVLKSKTADFRCRYFTPREEIPMAGHPTIATVYSMFETKRLKLSTPTMTLRLELQVGIIEVEVQSSNNQISNIIMTQKKPKFLSIHDAKKVAPLFNLSTSDLLPNVPIQTVSTGTPGLVVPVKNLEALRKAEMNVSAYRVYKERSDFFSPHLFCTEGVERGQTFARHFGLPPDTTEDPFTGSATGSMAAYLWKHGLIQNNHFIAEQGHWMNRPGHANVEIIGPREDIQTVRVGGQAVTVLNGELRL